MTMDEQAMWGSHLPALCACVAATSGNVLELGVGNFSTPVLHALCGAMGRRLASVEADKAWGNKLADRFACDWHKFYIVDYDDLPDTESEWSVVLIDNSPGGARRARDFARFLPRSQFVVVHDYHKDNEEAIEPVLRASVRPIKHVVLCSQGPPTLIASIVRTLPSFFGSL